MWKANYKPFGEAEVSETSSLTFNLRFPGQYADNETGLNYNYFRSYNPGTGRYTQSDPIGLRGGLNTYAYAAANPVKFFDMLGLKYSEEECRLLEERIILQVYLALAKSGELDPNVSVRTYANDVSDCATSFPDEGRRLMCEAHEQHHSDKWDRANEFIPWLKTLFGDDYKNDFRRKHGAAEAEATKVGIDKGESLYKEDCDLCQ